MPTAWCSERSRRRCGRRSGYERDILPSRDTRPLRRERVLLAKIRSRRTFILQERGKIAAGHLRIQRILWADPT